MPARDSWFIVILFVGFTLRLVAAVSFTGPIDPEGAEYARIAENLVMDGPTMLAFHAAAAFVPFPYSDSDVAIRYLEKRKVNFVVLSDYGRDDSPRPYLTAWIEHGVPSARAKLIYNVHDTRGGRIRIYELGPAGRPTEGEHLGPAAGESNHVSRIDGP